MPVRYVPFIPEPIEGQAVLQNFSRVLKYSGADDVYTSLQRGMPLYELERIETVGENPEQNKIIRGECISTCAYLKENGIKVDLVYIDPPFASGADYAKKVYIRKNPKVAEAISKAEQEIDVAELRAFEEKMYGDVWDKEKYLNWMYENLVAIKSVMSDTASIYVHLDWHIDSYVKILLDEIFGEDNFKNEIVWGYRIQGVGKEFWGRKHDIIYYYSKSSDYIFHPEKEDVIYEKPFIDTLKTAPDMSKLSDKDIKEITTCLNNRTPLKDKYKQMLFYKHYSNVYVRDVWDCDSTKPIISGSSEYLGYSTQKPIGLLERIINASSNEGMVVADFFGGSGVTATVAHRLNRKFITCDVGINAIQTMRDRLISEHAQFDVMEIKDGVQLYRNPVQTMDKMKKLIPGLKNEDSLDSFWEGSISDSKLGTIPVYIPNLMDSSTKLLDKVLINRIIHQAIPDLDSNVKKVIVYYIDIIDEKEIKDFIDKDDSTTVEIELRDLKSLLDDVVIEDYAEYSVKENDEDLLGGYIVSIDKFTSDRVVGKIHEFNEKNILNSKKDFTPIIISEDGLELIEFVSIDFTSNDGEWHSDSEIKIDKLGYVSINGTNTKEFWNGKIKSEKKPLRIKIRNICGDETIYTCDN